MNTLLWPKYAVRHTGESKVLPSPTVPPIISSRRRSSGMFVCLRSRISLIELSSARSFAITWKSGCEPASMSSAVRESRGALNAAMCASVASASSNSRAHSRATLHLPTPCGPCRIHA